MDRVRQEFDRPRKAMDGNQGYPWGDLESVGLRARPSPSEAAGGSGLNARSRTMGNLDRPSVRGAMLAGSRFWMPSAASGLAVTVQK